MLGDFITRILILFLGYAYPGFECYKTVEKNRVEIEELRFWCQYWIIVALLTVLEKLADIFIAWLPMYGEMKLALFIYLWYPKTKGTGYIYETLLRPYVSKHENDIDGKFLEWRARAWDLAIFYWQNCTELGQTAFLQVLEYLAGQSARFNSNSTTQVKVPRNNWLQNDRPLRTSKIISRARIRSGLQAPHQHQVSTVTSWRHQSPRLRKFISIPEQNICGRQWSLNLSSYRKVKMIIRRISSIKFAQCSGA